jgi:hypothetical protein
MLDELPRLIERFPINGTTSGYAYVTVTCTWLPGILWLACVPVHVVHVVGTVPLLTHHLVVVVTLVEYG